MPITCPAACARPRVIDPGPQPTSRTRSSRRIAGSTKSAYCAALRSRIRSSNPTIHALPPARDGSVEWGVSLRDAADDLGELLRTRPHRPVARRQVDPGDVADLLQAPQPRVAFLRGVLVLLGGVPGADDRARDVEPHVV